MSFLTWPSALLAAALTIPLLLLLYFLKLRRRPVRVSSTFLWRKAAKEVEVNAPFRLLRFSLLLLLQLLLFLAIYAAIARPVLQLEGPPSARTILIIDTSASMSARDAGEGKSRLEVAKEQALEVARRTLGRGAAGEVKLITFAASAHTLSTFESSLPRVRELIEAIEPTDQPGRFGEVVRLLHADLRADETESAELPRVVLVSDGDVRSSLEDPTAIRLPPDLFRFVRIGPVEPPSNVGIVSMSARRDYDDPTLVRVFARLISTRTDEVTVLTTWQLDGVDLATEAVTLPPTRETVIGEASLTRTISNREGGLLTLTARSAGADPLVADDIFALTLPPIERPRLLVVAPGGDADWRLLSAVRAAEPGGLDVVSTDAYERRQRQLEGAHDLVLLDRVTPREMPSLPSISIAAGLPLPGLVVTPPAVPEGEGRILSWLRTHALMRYAGLDQVVVGETRSLLLPAGGVELARGEAGTLIGIVEDAGRKRLLVAFTVERTTWPTYPGFAIFIDSALSFLAYAGEAGPRGYVTTNEPASVALAAETRRLRIEGPLSFESVVREDLARATLPVLPRAGVYEIEQQPSGESQPLAVNLADARESLLASPETISVGGVRQSAVTAARTAPREIWHWFVLAAMGLLVVEWLLYLRQARQ
jgi:von Willebrand factor type A domain/Aerotolerance regulator N-terminal